MAVSQWVSTVSIVLWSSRAFSSTLGGVWATVQEEKIAGEDEAGTAKEPEILHGCSFSPPKDGHPTPRSATAPGAHRTGGTWRART